MHAGAAALVAGVTVMLPCALALRAQVLRQDCVGRGSRPGLQIVTVALLNGIRHLALLPLNPHRAQLGCGHQRSSTAQGADGVPQKAAQNVACHATQVEPNVAARN